MLLTYSELDLGQPNSQAVKTTANGRFLPVMVGASGVERWAPMDAIIEPAKGSAVVAEARFLDRRFSRRAMRVLRLFRLPCGILAFRAFDTTDRQHDYARRGSHIFEQDAEGLAFYADRLKRMRADRECTELPPSAAP